MLIKADVKQQKTASMTFQDDDFKVRTEFELTYKSRHRSMIEVTFKRSIVKETGRRNSLLKG